MALGHLDVVPVSEGWKHAPFGAEIDGEYLYARGATDDKGPTMAAFYAARALMAIEAELPARVRVVFGCDEESGFECVHHYFSKEEAPTYGVAPDSGWPLYHAEKGIANAVIRVPSPDGPVRIVEAHGGTRPNIVPDAATAYIRVEGGATEGVGERLGGHWDRNVTHRRLEDEFVLTATGKAAHGAWPFGGDSAVVRVLRAVHDVAPQEAQPPLWKLVEIGHPSGTGIGIHCRDDVSGDLTANLGILTTKDGHLEFLVNIRYPVTASGEEIRGKIESHLNEHVPGATLVKFDDSPPLYFPLDAEPVVSIVDAYRQETGDETPPGVMGGGTYARAVPNTVSIGTGWDGDGPAHENDERIRVSHLLKMAKIYTHILYRLAIAAGQTRK
jgi:succinyl-diaminopimelate desuccinylase